MEWVVVEVAFGFLACQFSSRASVDRLVVEGLPRPVDLASHHSAPLIDELFCVPVTPPHHLPHRISESGLRLPCSKSDKGVVSVPSARGSVALEATLRLKEGGTFGSFQIGGRNRTC